ncbi:hypothetical protein EVAR_91251_1 [Eumeta japonica]|uniref:Uncharacterized protein n=1 Tax=Eumeta variegata TaxID=151549 RepID=A0A4C2A259_EUMVA|nr:hypothetical protein EVAR_91251_1 [Eumeta japonica]
MNENGEKLDQLQDRLEFEIIAPSTATYFPITILIGHHRPVLLKWVLPTAGGLPHYQNHRLEESVDRVRKIDTPPLNSIPDDIRTTEQIDHAIELKQSFAPREYPTPEYRSRRELSTRSESSRSEFRNESWSDLMEKLHRHIKRFGELPGAQNGGYTPIPRLKTGRLHRPRRRGAHISRIEEGFFKTSLEPKDDLTPVSLSEVQLLVRSLKDQKGTGP